MDDPDKESPEAKGRKKAPQKAAQEKVGGQKVGSGKAPGESREAAGGHPVGRMMNADMMRAIRKELDRTGIDEKKILNTFHLKFMENMTEEQYQSCMKKFKVTPDKPGSKEGQSA